MNGSGKKTIKPRFLRLVVIDGASYLLFVLAVAVMGIPVTDPMILAFLTISGVLLIPFFAAISLMACTCDISVEGIMPTLLPTPCGRLRWEDIVSVRKSPMGLFFIVSGKTLNHFCILPGNWLLKEPISLKSLLSPYVPEGHIIHKIIAT
ncbi:hypothetical protein [Desulfosudis oleivorans]|uniref:hypothetical protein n=1 Tax=Desulfosudis oleivorans TaxID=181663 RepID=UPI0012947DB5|nr:hypothetical protein [Desulfosudis oleivorans]